MDDNKVNSFRLPDWINFVEVKTLLAPYLDESGLAALERYFLAANNASAFTDQLLAVQLFKQQLSSMIEPLGASAPEALGRLQASVADYAARCEKTVALLADLAPEVPKVMHFVWVGGSEVGPIQRDYMNIWRQVLAPQGHVFNLWYDSDALLAFEINRTILDCARLHAMEAGGAVTTSPSELASMIEDRARVLKQQMFAHLNQPKWLGKADEARIDLMVRAYGKDRDTLIAFRQKCLDSHAAMVDQHTRLRDVRQVFRADALWDVYEREVAMRGNFAAASDVVRLQAIELEGGRYSDLDYLPSLAKNLGGVDISKFDRDQITGVLQLLFNADDSLLPGRDAARYGDLTASIPAEHLDALQRFADSKPGVHQLFVAPEDNRAARDAMRQAAVGASEMNSHIIAQPGSGAVHASLEFIRFNYDCLQEIERRLVQAGSGYTNTDATRTVILDVLDEHYEKLPLSSRFSQDFIIHIGKGLIDYFMDGIRPEARGTIALTGPGATVAGLDTYAKTHLTSAGAYKVRALLRLQAGFTSATEEDRISGWTVNAGTPADWLKLEQEKWAAGRYKTRYLADLAGLLKDQTLTFEKGWPVIEGRAVLHADLLQRWADELGEPFIRAMNDKLSGDVRFDKPLRVTFDDRQLALAQPAAELPLSLGAEPLGNWNEVLARIAHGSLPLEQLSPAHRLFLGGLFGAESLDEAGFAKAWSDTLTLAQDTAERGLDQRYLGIEQALLKQQPRAFAEGFAAAQAAQSAGGDNVRALKALALAQPLTLRQWGEHVGRIRQQAERELRSDIFARSAAVLEGFIESGASTAKLMPQGLLIRREGDLARHCYPLVLSMAAALEKGPSAVDALSGRLANANLEPHAADAQAFLRALRELRTVPMRETGVINGAARLDQILQTLEARTTTGSLMLNTDNHSLLVAKVVDGESSSYRFYDPNFGVFGFEQVQGLRRGLEQFFDNQQVARLYGIEPSVDATFNIIDLNGAGIADLSLPSNISVAALLDHGPIGSGSALAPWRQHAGLRVRSLSENARLGRGLCELDARHWATQIERSSARLQAEGNLGRDYVPVFESVREMPRGRYDISLVHLNDPQRTVRLSSTDGALARIKSFLTETFQTLSVKPSIPGVVDPTDISPLHTMNAAFTVQALLLTLHDYEQRNDFGEQRSLTTAVRMHGYLSYAQLAHGNVVDLVELVTLVRVALNDAPLVARTTSSVVVNALSHIARDGVATVLQLATVGFDIYLLVNARNDFERAQYGTQLAFDATGLALSTAGIGAGLAGASTAAAFLGGAGVILGGLAIGIGALVQGFNGTLERGQQIGRYLNRVKRAYDSHSHTIKDGIFYPSPYAHIEQIDLRNKRLTFGSQEILGADDYSVLHVPNQNPDRSKAINIRQHFGLAEHAALADVSNFQTLVLPCVAKTWFGFDYSALPFSTTRTEHFETALALENDADGNRQFWFTFYRFPTEYILHNLYPVEVETTIKVCLDEAPRALLVPELPKALHGKLTYVLEGNGGHCVLAVDVGVRAVHLMQAAPAQASSWTLRAPWLGDAGIVVEPGRLRLGELVVEVEGTPELLIQTADDTLRVDWTDNSLLVDDLALEPDADTPATQDLLRALSRAKRLARPLTTVQNFRVPLGDPEAPQHTTAYYEQARDRFIYSRDLPPGLRAQASLGAVVGQWAYLYASAEALVWRVDVVTGQVDRFYQLMDPVPGSSISLFQDLGQGAMRIVQHLSQRSGHEVEVTYLLGENDLLLLALAGQLTPRQEALLGKATLAAWSNFCWDYELLVRRSKLQPRTDVPVVDYQPAAFTSITRLSKGRKEPISTWVRSSDGLLIRPNVATIEGPGGPVSPLLLTPPNSQGNTFVFYDKDNRSLYRQTLGVQGMGAAERIELANVIDVIATEGRYVALTRDGLYFDIDEHGQLHLAGVTEDWLHSAREPLGIGFQWWTEVAAVATKHHASSVAIIGLGNGVGNEKLCAWYVDGRPLVADMGGGKVVRLLALTSDKEAAWLLDVSAGHIYRQAFVGPEQLSAAFANDLQLHGEGLLPTPQQVWPEWSFVQAWGHEDGLRGRTADGVEVEMYWGEPARVVGVTAQGLKKNGSQHAYDAPAKQALKALTHRFKHAPFIQVGGYQGYHWYVSELDRVLGESNTQLETRILGVRNKNVALLHEVPSRLTYSTSKDIWLANSLARREVEVLTLQSEGAPDDLLRVLPDGVTRLILSDSQDAISCRVSKALWQRLECVVLDGRPAGEAPRPGTLSLETGAQDDWRVERVEQHVLFTDPDNGHCLILRDVLANGRVAGDPLTLSVQVLGATRSLSLEQLLAALAAEDASHSLAALVASIDLA